MEKRKCFIAIGHLKFGGIQKSLLTFLEYILPFAEVDLLVWDNVGELQVPAGVNILNVPTVKSVKYCVKKHGLFSKNTFYSIIGCFKSKRWKVLPKIKKHYDLAISYTNGGYCKYFIIDKVNADKKYTFFHNGAYVDSGKFVDWDKEYYPKFDKVFAVSEHIKYMLINELGDSGNFDVLPNLINIEGIKEQSKETCEYMDDYNGLKILTVGRLSPEKNPFMIVEVAKELLNKNLNFKWYVVGAGDLLEQMQTLVKQNALEENVVLCGGQLNSYKFMSRCDIYAQFSHYEADPITAKEVSIFNKKLFLSDIDAYRRYEHLLQNIFMCPFDAKDIANRIEQAINLDIKENGDLSFINEKPASKTKEIFSI